MEDDNLSVRTPTNSEINMFRVMANQDFVDLKRPIPKSTMLNPLGHIPEELPDIFPTAEAPATDVILDNVFEQQVPDVVEPQEDVPEPTKPSKEPDSFYLRAKQMTDDEIVSEKEGLLLELQMLEKQGIYKATRHFTMDDSIEELQFQVDRANSIFGAQQAVEFAKTGIKVGASALEMALKKFGLTMMTGLSANLCSDMNKFNRPLTKLYRKYWRRGGGLTSPETELLMVVGGSMLMTAVQNTNAFGMGSTKPKEAPSMVQGLMQGMMGTPTAPTTASVPTAPKPSLIRPPVIPSASWQPAPVVVPSDAFQVTRSVVVDKAPNGLTPTPRKKKDDAVAMVL